MTFPVDYFVERLCRVVSGWTEQSECREERKSEDENENRRAKESSYVVVVVCRMSCAQLVS